MIEKDTEKERGISERTERNESLALTSIAGTRVKPVLPFLPLVDTPCNEKSLEGWER
jgi:hypothetical protein